MTQLLNLSMKQCVLALSCIKLCTHLHRRQHLSHLGPSNSHLKENIHPPFLTQHCPPDLTGHYQKMCINSSLYICMVLQSYLSLYHSTFLLYQFTASCMPPPYWIQLAWLYYYRATGLPQTAEQGCTCKQYPGSHFSSPYSPSNKSKTYLVTTIIM